MADVDMAAPLPMATFVTDPRERKSTRPTCCATPVPARSSSGTESGLTRPTTRTP